MSNADIDELNDAMYEAPEDIYPKINRSFRRKFHNPDMATCWLNSCLQLVLNAMDHGDDIILDSELGLELKRLQTSNQDLSLNPTIVKDIIVSTEDTRVASRLSRLLATNGNKNQIASESRIIEQSRFDLRNGRQCVRDFFLCLNENILDWPDVASMFSFKLTHSTQCQTCGHENSSETSQMYLEMTVPADGTALKIQVEDYLNEGSTMIYNCEDGCRKMTKKIKKMTFTSAAEAKFILVVLSRGFDTLNGYTFLKNKTPATENISLR